MTWSILHCDPPRLLEYSWKENGEEAESVVTFEIAPSGRGTIPALEHRRIDPSSVVGFGAGWHGHLDAFGALLAGGSYDLDSSYQRLRPVYESRLAEDPAS